MFSIMEFIRKEAVASLMSVVLEIFGKILKFWIFLILNFFEIMEYIAKLPVIICKVKGNQRACVPSGHFHFKSLKQMFSIGAPWIHTYKAMYLCTI